MMLLLIQQLNQHWILGKRKSLNENQEQKNHQYRRLLKKFWNTSERTLKPG